MLLGFGIAAAYVAGFAFTLAATDKLGAANPRTYGNSLTGDLALDGLICFAWPLFWPAYLASKLGAALFR
jgi:hypothetical protein